MLERLRHSEDGQIPLFKKDRAVLIASRLSHLFETHTVMLPVTIYQAHFGPVTVHGSYGVLSPLESKDQLVILRLVSLSGSPLSWSRPDLVDQTRYLHFRQHAGSQKDPMILKYSVTEDWQALLQPSLMQATAWVSSALRPHGGAESAYPAPGPHCQTCLTQSCMEPSNG